MVDAQTVSAAARAAVQATRMMQAAANPYVMVKHGRREDRTAAYDRFIAACASFYYGEDAERRRIDQAVVNELLAALQAVDLRAPRHVREAANGLFHKIVGWDVGDVGIGWMDYEVHTVRRVILVDPDAVRPPSPEGIKRFEKDIEEADRKRHTMIDSSTALIEELRGFTNVARMDVLERWWHNFLTPWGKRWWLARK